MMFCEHGKCVGSSVTTYFASKNIKQISHATSQPILSLTCKRKDATEGDGSFQIRNDISIGYMG